MLASAGAESGLPPRVRSRLGNRYRHVKPCGITSACAEQTIRPLLTTERLRDYLRVCGADHGITLSNPWNTGLPPRVRSRQCQLRHYELSPGITSACAEQTGPTRRLTYWIRDYLRVCGADGFDKVIPCAWRGLPPRVRSRHTVGRVCGCRIGITSACAEQTVVFYCVLSQLNGVEYLIYALRRVS